MTLPPLRRLFGTLLLGIAITDAAITSSPTNSLGGLAIFRRAIMVSTTDARVQCWQSGRL